MAYNNTGRRQIVVVEAPAHPVAQLQGPFEESMFESQSVIADEPEIPLDAGTRRNMLLEAPTYQRVIAGRWKQKPGERYHPLWKLVAQMSFGIHLLSESMAKSEEDVFQILQTHVDDIDIFLERTTEDFTLAQDDIQERLKCLRLPLQHADVFERMLEDRAFRNSIVDGNEKIEHIVNRTGAAMKDALKDVQKGYDSTSGLERYLTGLETTWVRRTPEHEAVYFAMLGNVEGWKRAFLDLHMQGNKLAGSLRKLTEIVNQMQQKAGEVSRRLIRQQQRRGGSITSSNSFTYHTHATGGTRSSSRQQTTPASESPKKTLPAPSPAPARAHSRTQSREATRIDSAQGQRSGTGLSMRSGDLRSDTPSSRAASRTDTPAGREANRMNVGTPRIVFVKSNAEPHRANSHSASVRDPTVVNSEQRIDSALSYHSETSQHSVRTETPQNQIRGQETNISIVEPSTPIVAEPRTFAPVELPAEIPPEAFLQAPMSSKNRLSASLTFLPSERRAQATGSHAFNPATALVELLRDQSRFSKLPLTPSSTTSPTVPSQALSTLEGKQRLNVDSQPATQREPTPDQTPPVGDDGKSSETLDTPSWAVDVVDDNERQRILAEKIPFSTRSPEMNRSTSPTKVQNASTGKPQQPKLDTAIPQPGRTLSRSEKSSAAAPSELSAGYEDGMPTLTRQQVAEASMLIETPETTTKTRKKLSFIAELEGSEPIFLPSTVYTPTSAAHELEAPGSYFALPIQSDAAKSTSATPSELSSEKAKDLDNSNTANQTTSTARSNPRQAALEEAIRKSISDADIPLPSPPPMPQTSQTEPVELSSQLTPKPKHTQSMSATKPEAKVEDNITTSPKPDTASTDDQNVQDDIGQVDEKRVTTIHTPLAVKDPATLETTDTKSESIGGSNEDKPTKSRPVTTIHSPSDTEKLSLVMPPIATKVDTISTPLTATAVVDSPSATTSAPVDAPSSKPITKDATDRKSNSQQSLGTKIASILKSDHKITTPSSAPNTGATTSPHHSMTAVSPASLVSVHSAPGTDLHRSNTKDSRKQWKAFFTGQLKSPKSPSAGSAKSAKSNKSRNTSISSSHKHSNSVSSQTNASVKTLWLTSPTLADVPAEETLPEKDTTNLVHDTAKSNSAKPADVKHVDVLPDVTKPGKPEPTAVEAIEMEPSVPPPQLAEPAEVKSDQDKSKEPNKSRVERKESGTKLAKLKEAYWKTTAVADSRQQSNPTLASQPPFVGLGLITSPSEQRSVSATTSPLSPTPTVSMAIQKYTSLSASAAGTKSASPGTTSTLLSFPKPRMIEVRRKAVGSGISSGNVSRSESDARLTPSPDPGRTIATAENRADSRSTSPLPDSGSQVKQATPAVEDQSTPRLNVPSRGTTPVPPVDSTPSVSVAEQTDNEKENVDPAGSEVEHTKENVTTAKEEDTKLEQDDKQQTVIKGHERGISNVSNVSNVSKDSYDFLDAYT